MSQKSEEGETTYSHYLHGLLSEKGKKKKGTTGLRSYKD